MARQKSLIKINPKVVKWIIDDSGFDVTEIAEEIKVSKQDIVKWSTSDAELEIPKLKRLAKAVRRPMIVFFLPEPPKESKIEDYRRLPSEKEGKLTPDTREKIRDARCLQEIARELMEDQRMNMEPSVTNITVRSSPSKIARTERVRLGFKSDDPQLSENAKTSRDHYNILRQAIESFNIFVFQAGMQADVRGVTLPDRLPTAIVINSNDIPEARTFSLLHEYGHVLLKKDGICNPQTMHEKKSYDDLQRIEKWCNHFAASVLMPEELFLKEYHLLEESNIKQEKIMKTLAAKFKVSRQAAAIRIRNMVKDDAISSKYNQLLQNIKNSESEPPAKSSGGPSPARLCISRKGKKFVSLVLESEDKDIINIRNVSNYLDVKIKHLKEIEKEVF